MPALRDAHLKKTAAAPEKAKAAKLDPAKKYPEVNSDLYLFDCGEQGDPVQDDEIVFVAYGVEFCAKKKNFKDPDVLRHKEVRGYLAKTAEEIKNRTAYIVVNDLGEPHILSAEFAHPVNPEEFTVKGVKFCAEKGDYNKDDPKDKTWLEAVANRFKKQRIFLFCADGHATIDENIIDGTDGFVKHNPY